MIVAAHQTMLAPQEAPLPYDAEVEYLESTGTQYFIIQAPGSIVRAVERFMYTNVTQKQGRALWGGVPGNLDVYCNGGAQLASAWGGSYRSSDWSALNLDCTVDTNGTAKTVVWTNNGTSATKTVSYASVGGYGQTLHIMQADNTPNAIMRLWFSRAYDSAGNALLDLQPVRVGSGAGAVGYLFDRVSGTLFGNAGTGAFTIGPDKT